MADLTTRSNDAQRGRRGRELDGRVALEHARKEDMAQGATSFNDSV